MRKSPRKNFRELEDLDKVKWYVVSFKMRHAKKIKGKKPYKSMTEARQHITDNKNQIIIPLI